MVVCACVQYSACALVHSTTRSSLRKVARMSEVSRYYYVMWPEEREASSTTSSPSANSPRAAGTSVAVAVENGSDSHSVVKVHSNGPKAGSGK